MSDNMIYYKGVGANPKQPNDLYTVQEFLDIMKKNFAIECSLKKTSKNHCKKFEKMSNMFFENYNKDKSFRFTQRELKTYNKLFEKCEKSKNQNKKTRKCNLAEYIKFSGAEVKR